MSEAESGRVASLRARNPTGNRAPRDQLRYDGDDPTRGWPREKANGHVIPATGEQGSRQEPPHALSLREVVSILGTSVLVAIVWVFGTYTAFDGRFSFFVSGSFEGTDPVQHLLVVCAFSVGLAFTRWDAFPRAFKICAPAAAAISVMLELPLYYRGIEGTILNALLCFTLALATAGIMTLWYEVLMKLGSPVRMLVAIMLGWALFYVFRVLLSTLPDIVCVLVVMCAPLALLSGVRRSLPETKDPVSFFPTQLVSLPVLRMVLVGVAGGIVSSVGHGVSLSAETSLFDNPNPLFMFLTGAYLFLVIQSAAAEHYLRASFFFAANFVWDLSMLVGGVFYQFAPGVSAQILTTIAYLLFFSAFATFLIRPAPADRAEVVPHTMAEACREVAEARGLTHREIEVLALLLQGRSVPFVEDRLRISEGTARTHVNSIYKKLGVHSRQDLLDLFLDEPEPTRP